MPVTRTACGDVHRRDGERLVIEAALPIDELEPAKFRAPVLLVDGERFVLVAKDGTAKRPVYTLRALAEAALYEPEGKVLVYDGARHLERRSERRRTALAWLLYLPTVPLLPLLGLLPEEWKDKLVAIGVDPGRATRLSIGLEWLLLALCLIAYPFMGGFFTLPGAFVGGLALFLGVDIAYRVTADYDSRAPGAFGVAGAIAAWLKDAFDDTRGKHRLLDESGAPLPQRRDDEPPAP